MPWLNDGTFERTNLQFNGDEVWQDDQQAGIKVIASRHDIHDEDIAQGIADCLNLDGKNAMRSDLDMGGFQIVNPTPGGVQLIEGSWTPQITTATMGGDNGGWYVRTGRRVTIFAACEWVSRISSGAQEVEITGLPFAIAPMYPAALLGVYAANWFSSKGCQISGIGLGPFELDSTGGGSVDMWNPEAVIQAVVPNELGTALQLKSYFGTNNTAVNGYGDIVIDYLMNNLSSTGIIGFQMDYLTNDPYP